MLMGAHIFCTNSIYRIPQLIYGASKNGYTKKNRPTKKNDVVNEVIMYVFG